MNRFDYFKFETDCTSSGIPVLVKNLPWCNGWSLVKIALRFGHWDIPFKKEGMAHLLEHLLFLGTNRYPTKEMIREQADRIVFQGTLGANTSWERLWLSGKLIFRHLAKGFDIFKELLFSPNLHETDLIGEKRVVLVEMWENYTCQANIEARKIMRKDFYGNHPMGRDADPAFGDEETVTNIHLNDVITTHKKYFHSGNLFLLFAGDIDLKSAMPLAEKLAINIPLGSPRQVRPKPESWPEPSRRIRKLSSRKMMGDTFSGRNTTRISMFRMLPKNKNPYFNNTVCDIYRRLLDEKFRHEMQITYGVRVSVRERSDHDELEIWMEVDPNKYKMARKLMEEMVSQFGSQKGNRKLFREVIAERINQSRITEALSGDILEISMLEFINYGRIYSSEEMHQLKRAITFEEITDYIDKELSSEKLYWWILTP